jgi:general stress protein 26
MATLQSPSHVAPGAHEDTADKRKKLHELIRSFDTVMLITSVPGSMHARPMAVAEISDEGELLFMTRDDTGKVAELAAERHALVVAQDGRRQLTVSGRAELSRDRVKIRELWKESWRLWADDEEDPRLMLIRVHPEQGEYWDYSGAAGATYLLKAAGALLSGKKMQDDDARLHGKVTL